MSKRDHFRHARWHRDRYHRHGHVSRRLYVQIFRAFLVMVVVSIVFAACIARYMHSQHMREAPPFVRAGVEMLVESPARGEELQQELTDRARRLHLELTLWDAAGALLANTGEAHGLPPDDRESFMFRRSGRRMELWIRLKDGRSVAISAVDDHVRPSLLMFVSVLILLIVLMGLASYPIARRITRRLEGLQASVERFGRGDLDSRVMVTGDDEIADLARAFNAAAEQIEALVTQQQRMLASASHELRSPLARLRMAHELILDPDDSLTPERRAQLLRDVEADIAELDTLVADVLMAARLEQPTRPEELQPVDLSQIAEMEAARVGATARLQAGITVEGNASMLSRMLRNLLDNAHKHGGGEPTEIEVSLELSGGRPLLCVSDRGPGIAVEDRERIFEPFYRPQGHAETRDGGVGLGLSLVRQIAEHHDAEVTYRPRDGGGSRFEVFFVGVV